MSLIRHLGKRHKVVGRRVLVSGDSSPRERAPHHHHLMARAQLTERQHEAARAFPMSFIYLASLSSARGQRESDVGKTWRLRER